MDKEHKCDDQPGGLIQITAIDANTWNLYNGDCDIEISHCPYCGIKLEVDNKKVIENVVNSIFKNQLEKNEDIHIEWNKDIIDGVEFGHFTIDYLSIETVSNLHILDAYCGIHISPSIDRGDKREDDYPYLYIELHIDNEDEDDGE